MDRSTDILEIIATRKSAGEPFALATVVRTVAATAAKAGAKAVILPDGTISEGWIGGGCARAAVLKAAKDALGDGRSWCRCSRPISWRVTAWWPATSRKACASPRICAPARVRWTSSSSRCCRGRK